MDSGLVTSERARNPRAKVAMLSTAVMGPSVTCRQCRVQIPLDDMDSHECNPKDLKTATHSPRAAATLLEAASKASSFLDAFLDTSSEEKAASSSQKTGETPATGVVPKELKSAVRSVEVVHASGSVSAEQVARPFHYESLQNSQSVKSSAHSDLTVSNARGSPQNNVASLYHSPSAGARSLPPNTTDHAAVPPLSQAVQPRVLPNMESSSSPSSSVIPLQCRVRGVRLNRDKIAMYSVVSNLLHQHAEPHAVSPSGTLATPREVIIERRYREFYAFALAVYSMFPSQELWQRLPPKTLCLQSSRNQSGGFLLRRKNGLDDFVRRALELIDLGSNAHGTIGQWYLVRKFFNLPPAIKGGTQPTKDRNLVAAMHEMTKLARQTEGWTTMRRVDEHDTTYEKVSDGFQMVKRVKTCPFPARAIFDRITKRAGADRTVVAMNDESRDANESSPLSADNSVGFSDPLVESVEVLRRENRQTWTERVVYKGRWTRRNLEMINLKTWKVDDSGSIVIVAIPAEDEHWTPQPSTSVGQPVLHTRVDCILGGWIISPIPGDDTCSVTWLMQANFGECDPRSEFTGPQGFSTAFIARSCLLSWADEVTHFLADLEATYDPVHYRKLGPLLSGGDFNKLKLERRDTVSGSAMEDPRVYTLAHELEPSMCLLIHKSTNTNALIFRTKHRRTLEPQQQLELDLHSPLKAEWIMFEKAGNPRQDLTMIERTTTYPFSTRNIGSNVFHFTLELLRRDCVLRYDAVNGYGLFTTLNGKPNMLLKRVYLAYNKQATRLSFAKLEEIHLFGKSEMEIISA